MYYIPKIWTLAYDLCPFGRSVCHNFLKVWEVSFPCSYQRSCLFTKVASATTTSQSTRRRTTTVVSTPPNYQPTGRTKSDSRSEASLYALLYPVRQIEAVKCNFLKVIYYIVYICSSTFRPYRKLWLTDKPTNRPANQRTDTRTPKRVKRMLI